MLPQKIYEVLRWIVVLVLPALGVLIDDLGNTWGWDLPYEAISKTLDIVAVFLGTIFCISKVVNDNKTTIYIKDSSELLSGTEENKNKPNTEYEDESYSEEEI